MATALELFKQANLESILTPALVGAGVGGLGYGASSFINDEEEDTSKKLKNSLLSALKGAGMGGLAGAGYGAGKELFSQLSAPKDEVGKLLQNNPGLDASPHGKNHFIEAMLGNAVSSPYAATAAGAGAGLAGTYAARSAGQAVFDKARGSYPMKQPIPNLNQQAVDLSTARAGMEGGDSKSFLSRIFDLGKNKAKNTDLSKTEALKHLVKENDSTIFPQKYDPYSTVSNANSKTKIMDMLGAAGVDNQPSQPGLFDKIKSKLFGATATQPATHQQIKAQQILKELGSPKMTALKQYGGNALKGGVIGAATSGIANAGMKGYLNAKYDDDQLKLWNELAK